RRPRVPVRGRGTGAVRDRRRDRGRARGRRDRRVHRGPTDRARRPLRRARAVGPLHAGRHARAARALERSGRTDAENLADHRAERDGARRAAGAMTYAYWILKYLHVIGAAVLLGTGAGIAFFMLKAHRTGDPAVIAGVARIVVTADFLFTASAVVVQPVTGA